MLPNTTSILTGIAALAAVLALVVLAGRVARFGGWAPRTGAAARRLRLEESLALDSRRRLQLLTCDGRTLLVMTGGATDLVIGWAPEQAQETQGMGTRS
jgi:flagellar protein FliO/FliZ